MITEDYCSYEIAKLLKEKGFDEYCWKLYELGDCDKPVLLSGFELSEESSFWNNKYLELYKKEHCHINDICSAPTLQMAMKWLRETHGIDIIIEITNPKNRKYYCMIWDGNNNSHILDLFDSYEEAVGEALKFCLEILLTIKINEES